VIFTLVIILGLTEILNCVGNLRPAMGARNQVSIGLSYRPVSLCSLVTQFQTRFLELIPSLIAGLSTQVALDHEHAIDALVPVQVYISFRVPYEAHFCTESRIRKHLVICLLESSVLTSIGATQPIFGPRSKLQG
jgi:hypothetical protein